MNRTIAALSTFAALALAALASPAAAASYPTCLTGGSPGLSVHISIGSGPERSKKDQEVFDKMLLRRAGIAADTVERMTLGCLKVTRFENGRWITEYYDPDALEQGPLVLTRR